MHGFGYSGVPWILEPVLCTYLVMTIADLLCYRLLEVSVWQMDRRARDSGHTEPLQAGAPRGDRKKGCDFVRPKYLLFKAVLNLVISPSSF